MMKGLVHHHPELPLTQGHHATVSGNFGEGMVEAAFAAYGVKSVNDNPEFHYEPQLWPRDDVLLIRQHEINGIKIDYLYKNFKSGITLPIECKNQKERGSTDQKLAFV